jgi:hypothetical protein
MKMSNRIEKLDFFKLLTKKEEDESYEESLSAIDKRVVKQVVKQVEPLLGRIPVIFGLLKPILLGRLLHDE